MSVNKLAEDDSKIVRDLMRKNIVALISQSGEDENKNEKKTFLTQFNER